MGGGGGLMYWYHYSTSHPPVSCVVCTPSRGGYTISSFRHKGFVGGFEDIIFSFR